MIIILLVRISQKLPEFLTMEPNRINFPAAMIKTDILKVECNSVTNEEVYSFKLEWPARLPKKYFQFIAQWRFKNRR